MTIRILGPAAVVLALFVGGCGQSTVNQGAVSEASGTQPAAPAKADPAKPLPTWGKRYTWPDGMAIEVSAPAACKPSKYAVPSQVQRAVKFSITIINGTAKPFQALITGGEAQFAGKTAENVYDSGGPCGGGGMDSPTILPGKTFTYDQAYSVGPAPGEMQLEFQPDFGGDKAVFVGQA